MKAFLTISQGGANLGTLRLNLRPDIVPRTVENFVHFLTAHNAQITAASSPSPSNQETSTKASNKEYNDGISTYQGYRNSKFHRIIPKFMAQGGDFLNHDGTGTASMYSGSKTFPDENFLLSHNVRGTLSMANSGRDTNGCQFFITFRPTSHLDGKHVVFGYVDCNGDEESCQVLERLEKVTTDRRTDRPLVPVVIQECGLIKEGVGELGRTTGEQREKLVGEAKKNKLLQAYGDVEDIKEANPAADEDEIDLDDDDDDEGNLGFSENNQVNVLSSKEACETNGDDDEIDPEQENNDQKESLDSCKSAQDSEAISSTGKVNRKKLALQKRLAALRVKINQSRNLNRREVRAEATRMGSDAASIKEQKRLAKEDRDQKQKEYDTYVVGKLRNAEGANATAGTAGGNSKEKQKKLASLSQPAYESIRKMNARAEKAERAQFGPDDYYNPEGQYSNYERNLKSIRHHGPRRGRGSTNANEGSVDSYDPTLLQQTDKNSSEKFNSEREGARRLADEMRRRAEKRANQKRKPEFDAYDVSYINERNKKFNEKIGRNFDKHTAEIRQNLERGTAL